ncbi:MAG: type II secretion system protein GspM, partial [Gammaproteobacteria bacterium]
MKELWSNLSQREQRLIGSTLVLSILCLLYFVIVSPLGQHVKQLKNQVQTQQQLLLDLQTAKQKVEDLNLDAKQITPQKITSGELLSVINQSLQENQIKSYVILVKPIDSKSVFVAFKSAPFDSILLWLNTLWKQYEI